MNPTKIAGLLRFIAIAFCFIFWAAYISAAQKIFQYGIGQGLSNNGVSCIYQDHNGFMWFGTFDGLNRFDGTRFTIFRNQLDAARLWGINRSD